MLAFFNYSRPVQVISIFWHYKEEAQDIEDERLEEESQEESERESKSVLSIQNVLY